MIGPGSTFSKIGIPWSCADPERGTGGPEPTTPPKNHKNISFLSNTGSDHLKNHKATKQAFNVGPSSARQRNAILMAFRWRDEDGPLWYLDPTSPHQLEKKRKKKKRKRKVGHPLTKLSGSAHAGDHYVLPLYWARYMGITILLKNKS